MPLAEVTRWQAEFGGKVFGRCQGEPAIDGLSHEGLVPCVTSAVASIGGAQLYER